MASVLVLATVALMLPVATAGSAPKQGKTYNASVETPEWAGATDDAYTVTITNTTGTQQLGSANVTIPTATAGDIDFTVTSAPRFVSGNVAAATIARPAGSKVIELRNLSLPPAPAAGSSVTFTLGLRMPCVARTYNWGFDARQSNDFSGTPGNTLGPVTGTTGLTVQGSCKLRFDPGQPTSAEINDEITADPFQPDSANPVAVEAVDGSPTPQRLTWFGDTVELTATGGPGSLSASSPASAGLATFDGLSIALSGNYNLIASAATAPGFSDGESADFQIIDDVGACSSAGCNAQVNGNRTSSSLTGTNVIGAGFALLSLNLGTQPVCAGYTAPTNEWYEFQLFAAAGDKTIEAIYSKAAMRNVAGPSALEICFASPQDFPAKLGTAPFDYDGDPANGAEGFVGLLPNCPQTPLTPCVLSRNGTTGGGAIVTFFVPAAWGDPRYW